MYEARIYINDRYQFLASDNNQITALERALPLVKPEFQNEIQSLSAAKWKEIGSLGIDFLSDNAPGLLAAPESAKAQLERYEIGEHCDEIEKALGIKL